MVTHFACRHPQKVKAVFGLSSGGLTDVPEDFNAADRIKKLPLKRKLMSLLWSFMLWTPLEGQTVLNALPKSFFLKKWVDHHFGYTPEEAELVVPYLVMMLQRPCFGSD